MRSVLALVISVGVASCSNACPAPVLCTAPHPDYCPCIVTDGGRPDAFVDDDAFIDMPDAGDDANSDANAVDANRDANTVDANVGHDANGVDAP